MNILFIGPPGSGKGTQSEKLKTAKNLIPLSTGDLFRKNLKNKTSLGQKARHYINKGSLVPDEITQAMVEDFVKKTPKEIGILFDGFPRNSIQASAFEELLEKSKRSLDKVFFFSLSDDLVVERLSGRLWAPKSGHVYHIKNKPPLKPGFCDYSGEALVRRSDDKEELIRLRLKVFHEETKPLLLRYEEQNLLIRIEAHKSEKDIFDGILNFFE